MQKERSRGQGLKPSEPFAFTVTLHEENATGSMLTAVTCLK